MGRARMGPEPMSSFALLTLLYFVDSWSVVMLG